MQMGFVRSQARVAVLLAGVWLLAASCPGRAGDGVVNLIGSEETPPVTTSATGVGSIRITADRSVTGQIKTTGIEGTAAHIHMGAPGESGPPIITLVKGTKGSWKVPSGAHLTDQQYTSFKQGSLYVNVHSAANKAGEIRAQLKP
jgi:hypothetical protein